MKIADFSSLFIAHTVAYCMEGGKICLNSLRLLEINFVLPCVRDNFMKVKYI